MSLPLIKILKVALPHVALTIFLAVYMFIGAAVFQWLESDHDLRLLKNKAKKLTTNYDAVANEVGKLCFDESDHSSYSDSDWRGKLFERLSLISQMHDGRKYEIHPNEPLNLEKLIKPRWTFTDAFLYSLSILSTTGYANVSPATKLGQIAAVLYGLFGIPMMVLMAVDIGRFLSDVVLYIYSKLTAAWTKLMKSCGCIAAAAKQKEYSMKNNVRTLSNDQLGIGTSQQEDTVKDNITNEKKSKLPLWANFSLLLLFNTFGAFLYMMHNRTNAGFLESFFVCFNLLANLTMAEVPVVDDTLTILYIVLFVTFGLAVLSMCADLAASELKWVFMKIHYFGRKISKKRDVLQTVAELVQKEEMKTLLSIIEKLRFQYPTKSEITYEDITEYLKRVSANNAQRINSSKCKRRPTTAFMPFGLDVLKFVDADDVENTSSRMLPSIDEASQESY